MNGDCFMLVKCPNKNILAILNWKMYQIFHQRLALTSFSMLICCGHLKKKKCGGQGLPNYSTYLVHDLKLGSQSSRLNTGLLGHTAHTSPTPRPLVLCSRVPGNQDLTDEASACERARGRTLASSQGTWQLLLVLRSGLGSGKVAQLVIWELEFLPRNCVKQGTECTPTVNSVGGMSSRLGETLSQSKVERDWWQWLALGMYTHVHKATGSPVAQARLWLWSQ